MGQGGAAALTPALAVLLAGAAAPPARAVEPPPPSAAELAEAYGRVDGSYYLRFTRRVPRPEAEVALGRSLFFDPRLSADGTMSCGTCHRPDKGWADGRTVARGRGGKALRRNTPTVLDLRERTLFFWDGRVSRLSDQVLFPIQDHDEMAASLGDALARLRAVPFYADGFPRAYGGPATAESVARALTAYLETLDTPADSPFDRARTDPEAMSPAARRGLVLFAGRAGCLACHQGPMFSDHRFHNLGMRPGAVEDPGRWAVARTRGAYGAFRTPGLRNVARTAPYMHDGRFAALADVVSFYDRGGDAPGDEVYPLRALGLTPRERADLVAFLEALDSTVPSYAPPAPPPGPARAAAPVAAADAAPPKPAPAASDRTEPPPARPAGGDAPGLDAACRDFTLERFVAALGGRDADTPRARSLKGALYDDAVRALVYRSLAAGSDAPCAPLAGLSRDFAGISQSADFFCRDWYRELALVRAAAARGPELGKVCRESVRWSYGDFDAADADAVCSAVASDLDKPEALCARLTPRYLDARQAGSCVREYSLLGGSAYDCARGPDAVPSWVEQRCAEYQLYHKARASKDAEACGAHHLCRALMGDAAGQAKVLEERVKTRACGRPS